MCFLTKIGKPIALEKFIYKNVQTRESNNIDLNWSGSAIQFLVHKGRFHWGSQTWMLSHVAPSVKQVWSRMLWY